ncbi:signal peptide protein [Rhodopirellula maiorica SM1]|uniref:Signal peptide protein n=1 Tax=Rhodopirellula maiorica SM1 TaxID=1265738 RepID=M5S5P4_9BACT|nr:hypothetical protein [Rhodopirellula maiorica]EMI22977.1 signal peptide protein [Rhodopirellula maiorica SM1]
MTVNLLQTIRRSWSIGPWFSILFLSTLAIGSAMAESDAIDAERWRLRQLKQVTSQIQNAASDDERLEYVAQQSWLRRWEPGRMPSAPTRSQTESELVEEPLLEDLEKPAGVASHVWQQMTSLQAELHAVDTDDERKEDLRQIIKSARRLEELLSERLPPQLQELPAPTAWALAYTRYRLGRALAYRELPSVRERWPISDPVGYQEKLLAVYQKLIDQANQGRPEFILLEDRILRRAGKKARALELLEANQQSIEAKWYLKKRRDLLEELGWGPPHKEAAQIYYDAGYRDEP